MHAQLHITVHFAMQALTVHGLLAVLMVNNTYFHVQATKGEWMALGDVNPAIVICVSENFI